MKWGIIAVLGLALANGARAAEPGELVLVTHASNTFADVTAGQVRRAFMGLTVSIEGQKVQPIINDGSASLREAFLQHVVGLTEGMYQRRRLTLELQQGVTRPVAARDAAQLLERLRTLPASISFMWRRDAEQANDLRILRVIWAP